MLKKQVGPFKFQKTPAQLGNGRVVPNDFTKCCVVLKLESFAGMSNEDILSNSLTYALDCNIDVTIGLGEEYFDCGVDICLKTMVEGETARCKIDRISSVIKTNDIVQRNNKIVPDCKLKHSDCCASNKLLRVSVRDAPSNVEEVEILPEEANKNCKLCNYSAEITSTNIEIPAENGIVNSPENDVKALSVGDCDASKRTVSHEVTNTSIQPRVSSCLVIDITLVSFASACEVHRLVAEEQLGRATLLKDLGVSCFKRSDVSTAFYKFSRSLRYLLVCSFDETETELFDAWNLLRCQCYLNIAACQLQREHFVSARLNCSRALELDADNVKGLFRRAQASLKLDEYEDARTDLEHAFALDPSNMAVVKSLSIVQNRLKTRDKKLGDAMSKLFK